MIILKSFCKKSLGYILVGGIAVSSLSVAEAQQLQFDPQLYNTPYDSKTYPGITCEAQAVPEMDDFSNLAFDMVNANSGKRNVVCPIVRDNTTNTDGTHSVYVNVSNAVNRTLECTLYSSDQFGSFIDSDSDTTSNGGNQTLYLDVDNSAEDGFYGINCNLPYTAAIRSYEVREFLDTGDDSSFPFLSN